jgi:uncharacterized protein (DUF1697 family)
MATHIALLRGINVGRAKRVAMADLRKVMANLGYTNVRTLLNSGNVVFDSPRRLTASAAAAIRDAVAETTGVTAAVIVVSAADLAAVVAENPLGSVVTNPSRCLVAFPAAAADLAKAAALVNGDWAPDQFAVGARAAYLWCASGILANELAKAFDRLMGAAVTARNWATVLKLHAMSQQ